MNDGPEQVSCETTIAEDGTETETTVVRHWGAQFVRPDGSVYITRWDPGYGTGVYVPYSKAEAQADVASPERDFIGTKRLVSRTETTTVVTTPWKEES